MSQLTLHSTEEAAAQAVPLTGITLREKLNFEDCDALPGGSQLADAGGRMPAYTDTSTCSPMYRAAPIGAKADFITSHDVQALEVDDEKFNAWVRKLEMREYGRDRTARANTHSFDSAARIYGVQRHLLEITHHI